MTGPGRSPSGGATSKRMLRWYGIGLLLWVLRLLSALLPAGNAVRALGHVVLPLAILLTLILAGRAAKKAMQQPSVQGLLVAVCYGVPSGLVKVLFPATPAQVAAALQKLQQQVHLTSAQLHLAQQRADSAASHWEGFVIVVILYVLLGLLFGWLGSLFGRGGEESRAV